MNQDRDERRQLADARQYANVIIRIRAEALGEHHEVIRDKHPRNLRSLRASERRRARCLDGCELRGTLPPRAERSDVNRECIHPRPDRFIPLPHLPYSGMLPFLAGDSGVP